MANFKKQGVSLYFSVLVMAILMAILLALISISVSQIRVIGIVGRSLGAFYAADTGVEEALYRIRIQGQIQGFTGVLDSNSYDVSITPSGDGLTIKSIGESKSTKRAIRARY